MSPFIISWLLYSERKYLLRSRWLTATISGISWRKTRELRKPGNHNHIIWQKIISERAWGQRPTGVAVPDYIPDHTHVAFRSQCGSWGATYFLGCNKAGLGSRWTMVHWVWASNRTHEVINIHIPTYTFHPFVQLERESIKSNLGTDSRCLISCLTWKPRQMSSGKVLLWE